MGNGCCVLRCSLSPQLTFGRLGQVVEDKKPITLKDISEVSTSSVPSTPGDVSPQCPMGLPGVGQGFQPHLASPCRRSTSS